VPPRGAPERQRRFVTGQVDGEPSVPPGDHGSGSVDHKRALDEDLDRDQRPPVRWFPWFLVGIIASALLGCGPQGGSTFEAAFAEQDGGVKIAALPVVLVDTTGLVVGMQVADNPDGLNGVHASRGFGNGVVVTWLGGACEKKVTLTLAAAYAGYTVNIDTEPNFPGGGCSSVGIGRGVTITFRSPIAAEQITLR